MKEFLENIKKSIYCPEYYQELLTKPFSYSFKYYLLFSLCLVFIVTIPSSIKAVPKAKEGIKSASSFVVEKYPEELEIKIKDGKAETNVEEPYFIKIPKEGLDSSEKNFKTENLLVIDTKAGTDLDKFDEYKTVLLLTGENLVYYTDEKITAQPLKEMGSITINKNEIKSFVAKATPYLDAFVSLLPALILVALLLKFFVLCVYLIFGALLIFVAAKIVKVDIQYGKAYQIGLHLMTLPILATTIEGWVPNLHVPFLFTILLVVGSFLNLKPGEKKDQPNIINQEPDNTQPKNG